MPIEELAEGELQDRIDYELKQIFKNIHDENVDATTARTLTLKLKFTPRGDRKKVEVESNISTKLANVTGVQTTVATGRNENTGAIEAREIKSGVPGQTYFDDSYEVRTDVGEKVEDVEGWKNIKQ